MELNLLEENEISQKNDEILNTKNPTNLENNTPLETTPNDVLNTNIDDANTTNCLALTIQKDHKLVAVKNVVIRSIRMTWKVIVSTIALNIIRLFS